MSGKGITYYIKEILKISYPIILGNLGFIFIGIGDVVVAGRHSTDTFAAISIATAILNCVMTFGIGLISAVSPILSNYRGEKKSVKRYFYPSLRFAMTLALIMCVVMLSAVPLIPYMGFEEKLVKPVQHYIIISSFSSFGAYLHCCMKEFLQAYEVVMFPNLVTIFCVFLNLFLNVIFVFGFGPIPSTGVIGLAIASFIVRYFMGIVLYLYCLKTMNLRNYHEKGYYTSLLKLGLPVSLAVFIEFVAFNSVAILAGRVSGVYAAAQNLICSLTTVSFMIPFAISNAIAIKTGFANGARQFEDLKKYAFVGIGLSLGFMACSTIVFLSFPKFIVSVFTADENLLKTVIPVMFILGIFQMFDGLQVSLSGLCKGVKQTDIVLFANFIAYWCISIPVGCFLAFKCGLMLTGFWTGLVCASMILCTVMIVKLKIFFTGEYNNREA